METLWHILTGFWAVLAVMAPYLLFGFAVAGVLSVFLSPAWMRRHMGGSGPWPILKASVFGVPLPLCSCGVIPVAAGLRRSGASKSATTSFLTSTPQTGVDSIFVTYRMLGGVFTVMRVAAAFLTGLIAGLMVRVFDPEDEALPPDDASETDAGACSTCASDTDACCESGACAESDGGCDDGCCNAADVSADESGREKWTRAAKMAFVTLPNDLGGVMLLGILIAGMAAVLVPPGYFADKVPPGVVSYLIMMVAGIPLYACSSASVPMAYAFMYLGLSPGAALVFLITGPATNAATITTIWKIMGRRTTLLYLGTVALCALAAGAALDAAYPVFTAPASQQAAAEGHAHHGGAADDCCVDPLTPGAVRWWEHVSGVALALIMIPGLLARVRGWLPSKTKAAPAQDAATADTVRLRVDGMTCGHCKASVEQALQAQDHVSSVSVDLAKQEATVRGQKLSREGLRSAVNRLGYTATIATEEV